MVSAEVAKKERYLFDTLCFAVPVIQLVTLTDLFLSTMHNLPF